MNAQFQGTARRHKKCGLIMVNTVDVRNRFKGLYMIDTVSEELWMEVCDIVQETGIKTIPMEKKCKMAVWGGCEKKRSEKQRRKGKI